MYGTFYLWDKDGKEVMHQNCHADNLTQYYTDARYKPDKKSFIYWKRNDSLNQFILREDKLRKEGVKGYTSRLVVYKLEMADGSVLELLNQLPK
jgi:hypothetical protein